jgi:hypothetical protein
VRAAEAAQVGWRTGALADGIVSYQNALRREHAALIVYMDALRDLKIVILEGK